MITPLVAIYIKASKMSMVQILLTVSLDNLSWTYFFSLVLYALVTLLLCKQTAQNHKVSVIYYIDYFNNHIN